jgi:hypothetical protein
MTRPRTLREVQGECVHRNGDSTFAAGGKVVHCDVCDGAGVVREITGGGVAGWCAACGADLVEQDVTDFRESIRDAHLSDTGPCPSSALRLYTPGELLELPEPRWLVEPFVPEQGIVVMFGPTGTYKTFNAIDIAGQVDGRVVYLSAEGSPRRFGERVQAWEKAAGRGAGIRVHPFAVNLLEQGADDLAAALRGSDESVRLVVIDTTSRNTPGADENSAQDTGRLIGVLDTLRAEFGCAILCIHHTGLENTERERGSSALRSAADVSIRAKRTQPLEVRLECAKMRDAEEFEPRIARLIPYEGSLVVVEAAPRQDLIERDVREYLRLHPDASQNEVTDAVTGKTDAVRAAYRKVRPPRPTQGRTPDLGAPQGVRPLRGAPRGADPTLDPDEWKRSLDDRGW